jgi:SHS2 domain-containing protein
VRKGFRLLDHTADFGLEIYGADPAALFTQAAEALFAMITGPVSPGRGQERRIEIEGADWPDLLVNWLRELLYLWNGERELLCEVAIASISENWLQALVTSVPFDPQRHDIRNEIKAVTYHQVDVGQKDGGWVARVYFDV